MAQELDKKPLLRVIENPIWSPTRLDLAELCMKAYWFQYVFHMKHSITPDIARGKLMHRMIEKFWQRDERSGLLVPGYSSYSAFVNSAVRDWRHNFAKTGETDGQRIEWDFRGQAWSREFIGNLAAMAGRVYSRYLVEEPRLATEVDLKVTFDGVRLSAKIDELRRKLTIRDHKSGFKMPKEHYLDKNIQMTDYSLCLWLSLQDERSTASQVYPGYVGIPLDEFLEVSTIEVHHLAEARPIDGRREAMTRIYSAKRTERSFEDLIETIHAKNKSLQERDFHPTKGRHCEYCFFRNVCNSYNPHDYHENEYERSMPLFASAGIECKSFAPPQDKLKKPRLQKSMIFRKSLF